MATTKPLIFTGIMIEDAGGGNAATFDKHLVDTAEVILEPVTSEVDDGQTLNDFYNANFAANLYDQDIIDDARVYTNSAEEPVKADITFIGATGAAGLKLSSVIINGTKAFDGNRTQTRVFGSKRSVQIDDSVAEQLPA